MVRKDFTQSAERALNKAGEIAAKLGTTAIGTEHLLYGLAAVSGTASRILKENHVKKGDILPLLTELVPPGTEGEIDQEDCDITPRMEEIVLLADQFADKNEDIRIGTEHLLLAILKTRNTGADVILDTLHANSQKMFLDVVLTIDADLNAAKSDSAVSMANKKGKPGMPMLNQYSRDLVEYAKEGRLDPVLGRDAEIESVIEILSRRMKNNPCMIGEPGVGKTAIAEGLAIRIAEKAVPENLADKRILSLDLSGMVAGSKYRGEFEERIKRSIREAVSCGNVILFIDELHTVIGAGGAEGALDASNILKPSLSRGEIQVIGATTRDEYRKRVEKDAALERRFQPVVIEEPTVMQTIGMLKGLRSRYEEYHGIEISDEALEAAARLSDRYINDRYLPDKAIDLVDEAAARLRLTRVLKKEQVFGRLESKIADLGEEKENALMRGDMDLVFYVMSEEKKATEELQKEKKKWQRKQKKKDHVLGEQQIAEVVAKWTKIPVSRLEKDETKRLKKLESILHDRVVGQDEAVEAVARAVRRGRVGLKDPKRPIGSFLFLGPTGVGKTELSKALAEAVFGSEKDIIRVDMSEYMEKQSVSKMVGSPPGYVGYEEGGQLSEEVRRKPYSVLLFDEIEKAHPDVFNMLLQILEDGHLTDSRGRRVDFKNTIIIMTSNAGAQRIISPKTLGFLQEENAEQNHKRMRESVMEEVKHIFKPEFINRIDEIIVFHALTRENVMEIAKIMMNVLKKRVKDQMDLTISYGRNVIRYVADKGFDKDYGARPLRRTIQNEIEDALAEEVVAGRIAIGDNVKLSLKNGKIIVQKNIKKQ